MSQLLKIFKTYGTINGLCILFRGKNIRVSYKNKRKIGTYYLPVRPFLKQKIITRINTCKNNARLISIKLYRTVTQVPIFFHQLSQRKKKERLWDGEYQQCHVWERVAGDTAIPSYHSTIGLRGEMMYGGIA